MRTFIVVWCEISAAFYILMVFKFQIEIISPLYPKHIFQVFSLACWFSKYLSKSIKILSKFSKMWTKGAKSVRWRASWDLFLAENLRFYLQKLQVLKAFGILSFKNKKKIHENMRFGNSRKDMWVFKKVFLAFEKAFYVSLFKTELAETNIILLTYQLHLSSISYLSSLTLSWGSASVVI